MGLFTMSNYDESNAKTPKLSNEEHDILRTWYAYNSQILMFEAHANLSTFIRIFGEDDAERLMLSFRARCDGKYQKFITFLTTEQKNDLWVHILREPRYK